MLDPEELYLLLPEDGEHLGFEAVRAAVSEQSERDVTEEELAQCIFVLSGQNRADWLPDESQLRRKHPAETRVRQARLCRRRILNHGSSDTSG